MFNIEWETLINAMASQFPWPASWLVFTGVRACMNVCVHVRVRVRVRVHTSHVYNVHTS